MMDYLKRVLCEVVNQSCSKILGGDEFRQETMLGVTVDNTSCFTLQLKGGNLDKVCILSPFILL